MPIVQARQTIRCTQARAFAVSQDPALRQAWDPFFSSASGQGKGDGLVRVVAWHRLAAMDIRYVAWFPPERAAMRMENGPRWLAAFAGSWAFLPRAEGNLDARFHYLVKAAPGWGWLQPFMLVYFRWETRRRLAALKHYLEANP